MCEITSHVPNLVHVFAHGISIFCNTSATYASLGQVIEDCSVIMLCCSSYDSNAYQIIILRDDENFARMHGG